jgi:hypothetical protein
MIRRAGIEKLAVIPLTKGPILTITNRLLAALPVLSGLLVSGCYVESGPPPATAEPVYVQAPPPAPAPPAPEAVPPAPSPEHAWVPGYHRWNGRAYEWQNGHYERRPHSNARYVAGHWERRDRGHTWVEGHWQ